MSYRSGDRIELARNDGWWGGQEPWQRVTVRFLLNDGARTAALLAGDVDMIEQIPTTDLARLRRDNRLVVTEIPSLRTLFLSPDYSRQGGHPLITDNNGTPLERNPFLDPRVRRALSMAINRDALVERGMDGAATADRAMAARRRLRLQPGRPPRLRPRGGAPPAGRGRLPRRLPRDPGDPQRPLAERCTHRPGRRADVEPHRRAYHIDAMPFTAFVPRRTRQEHAIQLGAWGSTSGEASNYLLASSPPSTASA